MMNCMSWLLIVKKVGFGLRRIKMKETLVAIVIILGLFIAIAILSQLVRYFLGIGKLIEINEEVVRHLKNIDNRLYSVERHLKENKNG